MRPGGVLRAQATTLACVTTGGALALTLAAGAAAQTAGKVPPHPRQLRFDAARPTLPSATGRRRELTGGAVAYFAVDRTLPLVEITVALPVGSSLDPPGRTGLTSLTGAMLRRGGAGARAADAFDDHVDALGLRLDSSAGLARGGASASAITALQSEALDALFDVLARPRFEESRLAAARDSLLQSMARRNDDPLDLLEREWEWLLHGAEHFSTRPVTPANIESVARAELVAHHRRNWRPEKAIFAVSGDFEPTPLVDELSRRLTEWRRTLESAGTPPARAQPPQPSHSAFTPTPGLYHVEAVVPQAKVALGHSAARLGWENVDRSLLEVTNELLGGQGAVSRLAGRLRTAEGLVYRASSRYLPDGETPGDFRIFFDTRPGAAARAVDIALREIRRLRATEPRPRELEVVKRTLLGRLRLAFDTAEEVAGYFAEDELLGRPHTYWETHRRRVEAATGADVRRVAGEYLAPERLVVLVVGPWRELSQGAAAGESELEQVTGHRVVHLPVRDPVTLEPLGATAPEG